MTSHSYSVQKYIATRYISSQVLQFPYSTKHCLPRVLLFPSQRGLNPSGALSNSFLPCILTTFFLSLFFAFRTRSTGIFIFIPVELLRLLKFWHFGNFTNKRFYGNSVYFYRNKIYEYKTVRCCVKMLNVIGNKILKICLIINILFGSILKCNVNNLTNSWYFFCLVNARRWNIGLLICQVSVVHSVIEKFMNIISSFMFG